MTVDSEETVQLSLHNFYTQIATKAYHNYFNTGILPI